MTIDAGAFKEFEHRGWTEVAAGYVRSFVRLTMQAAAPMLDAAEVRAGTRVLDVATGPGPVAAAAAARGAHVIGIDFSEPMVVEARREHSGIEFRTGDAEALDFADAAFDAVVCNFGMLHFADPDRAIAEAGRVLRAGGHYAFTVWETPDRAATFGLVLHAVESQGDMNVPLPPGPPFFRFADPAEARQAMERAGFADVRHIGLPLSWRVDHADALLETFLEGGVRTRALLRGQTPEAMARIRVALREGGRAYEKDGALELPTPAVLCVGRRP